MLNSPYRANPRVEGCGFTINLVIYAKNYNNRSTMNNFLEQALNDKNAKPEELEEMSLSQAEFNPWYSRSS